MKDINQWLKRLAIALAVIGVALIAFVCIRKFKPTSSRMDPETYFGFSSEEAEPTLGTDGEIVAAVVYEGTVEQERALIIEGNIYIDYNLVERDLNSRFYWDSSEGLMLFTTADQIFEIPADSSFYTIDGESFDVGYEIVKSTSSGLFLAQNFLEQYSDLSFDLYEDPARVVITKGSEKVTVAQIKKKGVVRALGGIKSVILTNVEAGEQVRMVEQTKNWTEIITADGYKGYIRNKRLINIEETTTETIYQSEYSSIHLDERVNLIWHQIDYPEMNENFSEDTAGMSGVNVISPTWYYLNDNDGGILSYADASYVEEAHEAGLQVWPLISNFSSDISTSIILATRQARQNVEYYLINEALTLGFDGINIDFEGVGQESGYDYVQFVRELSILCRQNGIILSVDIPVPYSFNTYYNREELGIVCDYVVMMGYDEHYVGSEAGSVASIDFEEDGIENTLEEMPGQKLISGIPFYSRVWYTETYADGTTNVTSEIVTMDEGQQILDDLGISASYDVNTGQNYAEWTDEDGLFCQIWLEDDTSIAERAALVSQYNLGGIAAWRLKDESAGVWEIIKEDAL